MSQVALILLLLMASLMLAIVGVGVIVSEGDRRRSMAYTIAPDQANGLERLRHRIETRLAATQRGQRLRRTLDRASLSLRVGDAVLICVLVGTVLAVFSYNFGGPLLMAAALVGALLGLRGWLRRREIKRTEQFIEQLPELSRLLANAASAGLSLRAGLSVASREMAPPMNLELHRVNEELSVGASLESSLERLEARMPSRELAVLVNTLIIQNRSGGRVVTALHGITEALDVRRDLRREVATLTAGSRATVMAVSAMGGLMVLLVHVSVPGGMRTVLENIVGLIIVIVSGGIFALGIWLARRAARVEV